MCLWILLMICSVLDPVKTRTNCNMKNFKIACTSLEQEDLYRTMEVFVDADDVLDLSVGDALIPHIDRGSFGKYRNMHTLNLQSDNISYIEQNAFADLLLLRNLTLRNNLLERFSSNMFGANNTLYWLDLSKNLLEDLTDFNISFFPSMMILNVSNNRLQYLPDTLTDKLKETNDFYLIIDNNPWNCSHPAWSQQLNPILVAEFCTENLFDASMVQEKLKFLEIVDSFAREYKSANGSPTTDRSYKKCTIKSWCFSYCVFWFVAAIWIGIILGNVCKLREIVCRTTLKMRDKSTQYDVMDMRPRIC